jgi:Flp pilus assembly protein TadB
MNIFLVVAISLIGASGIFVFFRGTDHWNRREDPLQAGMRIRSGEAEKPFFFSTANLEVMLHQAELDVSARAFLNVGFAGAVAAGGAMFAFTSAIVVAAVAFFGFFAAYYWWLVRRRENKRMVYEESIADWADMMAIAASESLILEKILIKTAEMTPAVCREDSVWVADQIHFQNISGTDALKQLCDRRHSAMLSLLTQTLVVWSQAGSVRPLAQILAPQSESLRSRARIRNEAEADLSFARYNLAFVTVAPIAAVVLMRISQPLAMEYYASPEGQLLVMGAVLWSFFGYYLADRFLAVVRRTIQIKVDVSRQLSGVSARELRLPIQKFGSGVPTEGEVPQWT